MPKYVTGIVEGAFVAEYYEEENKDFNLENENNININENNYEEIIIEKPPINTLIL